MGNKNNFFSVITELLIRAIINDHDSYAYEIVKLIKEYSEHKTSTGSSNHTIFVTIKCSPTGVVS